MTTLHAISELICTSTMLGLIKLWRSRIREETVDWVWIAENSWWSVLPLSQRSRYVTVSWQLTFPATSFGAGLAGFYEYWSQPEWWFICCRPFRTIFMFVVCLPATTMTSIDCEKHEQVEFDLDLLNGELYRDIYYTVSILYAIWIFK